MGFFHQTKISLPVTWVVILISVVLTGTSIAQGNLVPNPGFEQMDHCFDASKDYLNGVKFWKQAIGVRPLYLSDCFKNNGMGQAYMDEPYARTGQASIAFYLLNLEKPGYRMFLQNRLTEPLKKGRLYQVEFYVKRIKGSNLEVYQVGMYLSTDSIHQYQQVRLIRPQVEHDSPEPLTNQWTKISGEYKANGGELYLVIGNFYPQAETQYRVVHRQETEGHFNVAYYFIDDVSVNEVAEVMKAGQTITLQDILFEVESTELARQAHQGLAPLLSFLKGNPTSEILISGHTDNTGDEDFNQRLSLGRAMAVKTYLVSQGTEPKRIKTQGLGSTLPIVSNTTREMRSKNRRVEILIQ
jgi:OOP family OmpA-OmpF porin